jgi:predicted nucleic acid-binding protein
VTKYVLDTNIFVQADRDQAWAEELVAFYAAFLPATFLHAVVVQELLLGAVDALFSERRVAGRLVSGGRRGLDHDQRLGFFPDPRRRAVPFRAPVASTVR